MLTQAALISLLPSLLAAVTSQVSPSGNYTPTVGQCPDSNTYVRPATSGLGEGEKEWLCKRQEVVLPALKEYLCNVNIPGFDSGAWYSAMWANKSDIPVIGVALSGGGTRAEMCGFGLYQAMDGRVNASLAAGTGGLLQAVTYWAGTSGGSETTMGLALNGFQTLDDFFSNNQFNNTVSDAVFEELVGKAELGYALNVADVFGLATQTHLATVASSPNVNPLAWTWSGVQAQEAFKNGSVPMPILMTVEVIPVGTEGSNSFVTPNGTILLPRGTDQASYEYNPFEFGSWTGRIQAFSDLQYFGTIMSGGYPAAQNQCVTGYDAAVFVEGTAISALNYWFAEQLSNGTIGQFSKRGEVSENAGVLEKRQNQRGPNPPYIPYPPNEVEMVQQSIEAQTAPDADAIPYFLNLTGSTLDQFLYGRVPNPFYGYGDGVSDAAMNQEELYLVDGSETGQEIPLWPMIQPARHADFLIASDNGGTEVFTGWANGSNFRNTYILAKAAGLPFPELPSVNTMLNYGYTSQPTFFGCNEPDVPLVLYVADFPYAAYSNISGFISIDPAQARIITSNALPLFSQDSGKLAKNFPQCIACGTIWRSLERLGWDKPEVCKQCMKDYCWQGQVNDASPSYLQPALVLQPNLTWAEWNATVFN